MKIGITVAELEDWRSDALLGFNPAKADKRILTLIGEVKRLQKALKKYGQHDLDCDPDTYDCSCGLTDALAESKQ